MPKRTKFKSLLLDVFILASCLGIASYFSYAFWKDLNSSRKRTDKEEVAVITFKNRIAQRKFDDRVVWERVEKSTPLYNGDLVRTSNMAEAVLTFLDDSKVSLYENTMIQIYYTKEGGVQLSVDGGSLTLDASSNGKMSLMLDDGSTLNVSGGTSVSAKNAPGSLNTFEVKNGSASITTKSGQSMSLESGDSASVSNGNDLRKNSIAVTSIPSELRLLHVDNESIPIKLEWSKSEDLSTEPVIIQTSTKKDFSEILEEKVVTASKDSLLNVDDGIYYWRVFPKNHKEEVSEGKISVLPIDDIQLLSPVQAATFHYRDRNPQLHFSWTSNDYVQHYLLKISSTPDMQNPVIERTELKSSVVIDSLGCGQWWWQVTPYYSTNSIGYAGGSEIGSFSIEKNGAVNPPSLVIPPQNAKVYYKDSVDVNFAWKSDIKDSVYDVVVSDTEDFSNIIYKTTTNSKKIKTKLDVPEKEGTYYWKVVRNSTASEDIEPESEVHSFDVTKYEAVDTKLLYPPEEYQAETSKLASTQFVWKLSDEKKKQPSVIQVSSSSNFEMMKIEQELDKQSFDNMLLPPGEWWWRIGSVDKDGKKTDFTEPRHIVVLKELAAPQVIDIEDNEEVLVPEGSPVAVSWEPVPGADYYNVRVFDQDNNLVSEKPVEKNNISKFNLPEASYVCKIQAVAEQPEISSIRTGPVEIVEFTVRKASPVIPDLPLAKQTIDGITALRKPTVFKWHDGDDKAASYELLIKRRDATGNYKTVERIKSTKNTVSVPRLRTGDYIWQVLASTEKGVALNSREMELTVNNVAPLPQPVLISPQQNFIMNTEYLRKNRSIVFEWNEVPEATGYTFVLYKKNSDGKLTSVYSEKNIKSTKIRIRKLAMLDLGQFSWSVTASCLSKDGFEERAASVATRNFEIKFVVPSQIETVDTGKMYAE